MRLNELTHNSDDLMTFMVMDFLFHIFTNAHINTLKNSMVLKCPGPLPGWETFKGPSTDRGLFEVIIYINQGA